MARAEANRRAGLAREAAKRKWRAAGQIHPKEQTALEARALKNVLEDLGRLIAAADFRLNSKTSGARTQLVASIERLALNACVNATKAFAAMKGIAL